MKQLLVLFYLSIIFNLSLSGQSSRDTAFYNLAEETRLTLKNNEQKKSNILLDSIERWSQQTSNLLQKAEWFYLKDYYQSHFENHKDK